MQQRDMQALERYLGRIRPIYHYLFNLAHAVTGSGEAARYALQCAVLQGWIADEDAAGQHGFREAMRRFVIRAALRADGGEQDWEGLPAGGEGDPLRVLISQESVEMQRVLALRCGCRLSARQIARACGMDARRVGSMLRRFEARMRRRLQGAAGQRIDKRIDRAVRAALHQPVSGAPDMGSVLRSFQAEAVDAIRPSRLPVRIVQLIIAAVLTLVCMAAFWFAAVLLQPPVLEKQDTIVEMTEKN